MTKKYVKKIVVISRNSSICYLDNTATATTTVHFLLLLKITRPAAGDSQPLACCHSNPLHFGIHIKLWLPTWLGDDEWQHPWFPDSWAGQRGEWRVGWVASELDQGICSGWFDTGWTGRPWTNHCFPASWWWTICFPYFTVNRQGTVDPTLEEDMVIFNPYSSYFGCRGGWGWQLHQWG